MRYSPSNIVLSAAALIQLSTSLPLEVREQNFRRAAYSIVNVDGGASSPSTETLAQTITKTTNQVSTATATATVTTTEMPSESVIVATIDVVKSSTTSTLVITATPEVFDPTITLAADPANDPSSDPPTTSFDPSSKSSDPRTSTTTSPAEMPPLMPFGDSDPITSTILVSSATVSDDPAPTDDCDEGDMWDEEKPTPPPSKSWSYPPTAYPTAYGSGIIPSDMPTLPKETPTWYNRTEIPPYRAMKPRAF